MLFISFLEIDSSRNEARFTSTHYDITPSGAVIHTCILRVTLTAKKLAFTVRKTKIEFTENVAFFKRLLMFCVRKIQRFLYVLASVNPSIRSIIR